MSATVLAATTTTFSSNPLWYLTRSTAVVAFVLLTVGTVLGVAATRRTLASPTWPRFATQNLHRNVNLMALTFVVLHILTTLLDTYVSVGWLSLLVPFTSGYRTIAVAAGTLSFDLMLAIIITSLLRLRMNEQVWRWIHWSSYLLWPLTMLHFIFAGTDGSFGKWGFWLAMLGAAAVATAGVLRLTSPQAPNGPVRSLGGRA